MWRLRTALPFSVLHYSEYVYMCVCVWIYSMSVLCVWVLEWNQSTACVQQVGTNQHRQFTLRQQCQHRLQDTSLYSFHITMVLITATVC